MTVAGILLTGGRSTRMGADKATLQVGQETLAVRTGRLLAQAAGSCVEVGPGHSGLPAVEESPSGAGPLVALVRGWELLTPATPRAVLVVATDLPALTAEALIWLVTYPGQASVIPVVDGHPQPLCARWSPQDLDRARALVAAGGRALRQLMAVCHPELADPNGPDGPGVPPFADVDTPSAARDLGVRLP